MSAAALRQRLGPDEYSAHMAEIAASRGRWTKQQDDYLMSEAGRAYKKNASKNTQQCDPPLEEFTIQEAYDHARYLRRKARGEL